MNLYHDEFELFSLPEGCQPTVLGNLKGADQQYRGLNGLHVRRYGRRFIAHRDRVDPREDPLGHLFVDAPLETAVSAGVSAGLWAAESNKQHSPLAVGIGVGLVSLLVSALMTPE